MQVKLAKSTGEKTNVLKTCGCMQAPAAPVLKQALYLHRFRLLVAIQQEFFWF